MRQLKSHNDVLYHALAMSGLQSVMLRERLFSIDEAVDNPELFYSLSYLVNAYSALVVHGSTFLTKLYKPSSYSGVVADLEVHPAEDNDLFPPLHNTIGSQLAYCLHVVSDVAQRLGAVKGNIMTADIFVEILAEMVEVTPSGSYIEPQPIMASLMEQRIMDIPIPKVVPEPVAENVVQSEISISPDNELPEDSVAPKAFENEFITPKDDSDLSHFG